MIAIIYNGGAYGTYMEWVLTTLTTDIPIIPPFSNVGNSHKFIGFHCTTIESISDVDKDTAFIRIHPKTSSDHNMADQLNSIIDLVKHGIYLYPDRNSVLLSVNNYYSKIWKDWWEYQLREPVFYNNLFDNFPISKNTAISDVPVWIKRELLSFNLMPSWFDQVEWYHPATWSHDRCQLVLLNELLYDFKNTILKIQKAFNLEFKKSVDDMIPCHNQMLSLQKWTTQDWLCNKILQSIIHNQLFDWNDQELPLVSQSWIQWQLRSLGYEIQCHGLDVFPTNTAQLRNLLTMQHTDVIIDSSSTNEIINSVKGMQ
jgi:hypothetical protein